MRISENVRGHIFLLVFPGDIWGKFTVVYDSVFVKNNVSEYLAGKAFHKRFYFSSGGTLLPVWIM